MSRNAGIKGDECQCGRRMSIRHCTSCGSTRYYGFAQEQVRERLDGSLEKVKLFRCLACSHKYTDAEREFCDAPPVSVALAQQKLRAIHEASKTGEYLRPEDKKLAAIVNSELKKIETYVEKAQEDDVLKTTRLRNSWFQLKGIYKDMQIADKSFTQPLAEFLAEQLQAVGVLQQDIDTVSQWQKEEDDAQRQSS
jgi:hypothetical protein